VGELERIKIGPWTATPALNLLERGERSVKIEPRAMDVLTVLAQRNGAVVSVEELIASVWKGVVVGDGSVYLAMRQLRQVLDDPSGTSYIETISKRGYRLTVPAEPIEAGSASAPPASAAITPPKKARRLRWSIGAAIVGAAVVASFLFSRSDSTPRSTQNSIAVLPFENLSSDPEQEYFADGVTEEILNVLAGVRDLRVIGRASSFQFKDRKEDVRTIGASLDVEHVLQGSVRKAGNQVRISAQLSNARSGQQLWSETYERKLDDVFVIQDEIAASVANALQIKLGVGDIGRVPGMTRNVAAYDEYLRSLALNLDRAYAPAIAHLQRAVALDPSFSPAWAALCGVYSNGTSGLPPEQAEEWRRQGAAALERARALTPDAPHVLLQAAILEARRGNWIGAAPLYDGLQPAYEKYGSANQAWAPRGIFLSYVGRERESIPVLERARAEDPLAPAMALFLSQAYLTHGEIPAALTEIDRGIKLKLGRPRLNMLAFWIAMNQNDRPEIDRRLQALRETSDGSPRLEHHFGLAKLIDSPAVAVAEIRRLALLDTPGERIGLSLWAAYFHAPELSLELLAREAANGEAMPILWQPLMRDARKLPAFKELVRAAGLVEYWQAYGWSDFCHPDGAGDFSCS
jgi:adenylate cyclase